MHNPPSTVFSCLWLMPSSPMALIFFVLCTLLAKIIMWALSRCRDSYISVLIFHLFYLSPDCLTVIHSLQTPFWLLRLVSVYTGPCQARLDYLVYIVSTLLLHVLLVPSASNQSLQYRKHPVGDISLGPGT